MNEKYYKNLYLIGSLYDMILGFGFLLFYKPIYALLNMNLPNNPAYLSCCTTLIGLFGILLFMIYKDLKNSRNMVIYATLVKFGFFGVVFTYYLFIGKKYVDLPFIILGVVDLVFGLLFLESLRFIKK